MYSEACDVKLRGRHTVFGFTGEWSPDPGANDVNVFEFNGGSSPDPEANEGNPVSCIYRNLQEASGWNKGHAVPLQQHKTRTARRTKQSR